MLVVSFGLFATVWATDGDADSVEGLVYAAHLGAALASLVAFALAVSARLG